MLLETEEDDTTTITTMGSENNNLENEAANENSTEEHEDEEFVLLDEDDERNDDNIKDDINNENNNNIINNKDSKNNNDDMKNGGNNDNDDDNEEKNNNDDENNENNENDDNAENNNNNKEEKKKKKKKKKEDKKVSSKKLCVKLKICEPSNDLSWYGSSSSSSFHIRQIYADKVSNPTTKKISYNKLKSFVLSKKKVAGSDNNEINEAEKKNYWDVLFTYVDNDTKETHVIESNDELHCALDSMMDNDNTTTSNSSSIFYISLTATIQLKNNSPIDNNVRMHVATAFGIITFVLIGIFLWWCVFAMTTLENFRSKDTWIHHNMVAKQLQYDVQAIYKELKLQDDGLDLLEDIMNERFEELKVMHHNMFEVVVDVKKKNKMNTEQQQQQQMSNDEAKKIQDDIQELKKVSLLQDDSLDTMEELVNERLEELGELVDDIMNHDIYRVVVDMAKQQTEHEDTLEKLQTQMDSLVWDMTQRIDKLEYEFIVTLKELQQKFQKDSEPDNFFEKLENDTSVDPRMKKFLLNFQRATKEDKNDAQVRKQMHAFLWEVYHRVDQLEYEFNSTIRTKQQQQQQQQDEKQNDDDKYDDLQEKVKLLMLNHNYITKRVEQIYKNNAAHNDTLLQEIQGRLDELEYDFSAILEFEGFQEEEEKEKESYHQEDEEDYDYQDFDYAEDRLNFLLANHSSVCDNNDNENNNNNKNNDNYLSPQLMAYDWLYYDPFLDTYPDWRILQRFALATLFFSTNHFHSNVAGWKDHTSWLSYWIHECHWFHSSIAVSSPSTNSGSKVCSDDGHYRKLVLYRNNLHGTLPQEVFLYLPELREVNLHENKLMGSLPSSMAGEKLKTLNLYKNQFTGTIPTHLAELTNLKYLFLDKNDFTGAIPPQVASKLSNLEYAQF